MSWFDELYEKALQREALKNSRQIDLDEVKAAERINIAEKVPDTTQEGQTQPLSVEATISPEALEAASQPLSGAQGRAKQKALILATYSGDLNFSGLMRELFEFVAANQEADLETIDNAWYQLGRRYNDYVGRTPQQHDTYDTLVNLISDVRSLLEIQYHARRDRAKASGSATASGE